MSKACIIIPCYNEENRLPVVEFFDFYNSNHDFDFCFVNDGSKDNTIEILQRLQKEREERILIVDLQQNQGKAESVRQGIIKSAAWKEYEYFGYFDADFATPLSELPHLMKGFESGKEIIFVAGSRVKRMGASIIRTFKRHYFGRFFATIAGFMLKIPVYDTQCGAKLIKREIALIVFEQPFISRWLFDIEVFARIIGQVGYQNILNSVYEVPLNCWTEKGDSRIKPSYLLKVPPELWKIKRKYRKFLEKK